MGTYEDILAKFKELPPDVMLLGLFVLATGAALLTTLLRGDDDE